MSEAKEVAEKVVIHKHMTIKDILSLFPHKAQRLSQEITNAGLNCVGCHAAVWETLEAGMLSHRMNEADIDRLVQRLNALLEEEEADATTITLTPRAAEKYKSILAEEGKEGWGIRFAEKFGGCNGFEYVLDYSEKALPSDRVFVSCDVEIHVDDCIADHMLGSVIDYVDGLHSSGFKVSNPHVRSSCGCGHSHGY
ncbi:iron-sulfur cluster assembly accessory protein [Parachlamydia sp. AcF125]|uniref:iron-sulfur cluster assembly accessory protein n=1 Tax=Parachlamydia sp. AcF125 TaxID=2795736 RepID=UPI001BC90C1A|nr:iron-sulfur cluster assembly accessory protein [Parachlamydia sp. AcF125]MBS4168579.1 Protein HesB, heterocyst [Parachlamydia sp. AcF125]